MEISGAAKGAHEAPCAVWNNAVRRRLSSHEIISSSITIINEFSVPISYFIFGQNNVSLSDESIWSHTDPLTILMNI